MPESNEFSPITTDCSCDPKGEWFVIHKSWGLGRTRNHSEIYMLRPQIEQLRDQLTALLEATKDGKILPQAMLDPALGQTAHAELKERLLAGRVSRSPRKRRKAPEPTETAGDPIGNGEVPEPIERPSGELKAARLVSVESE